MPREPAASAEARDATERKNDPAAARPAAWAERLGYPHGSVVLIVHADDMGMCPEANSAISRLLAAGQVSSASIMVPCPGATDALAWFLKNPGADVGVHATLTSEWTAWRWGPVAPVAEVPGLADPQGFLWRTVEQVGSHASSAEVEREVRAQIQKAIAAGCRPTHLDSHMGTLYSRADYFDVMVKLAGEFGLMMPVVDPRKAKLSSIGLNPDAAVAAAIERAPFPKLDSVSFAPDGETYEEVRTKLIERARSAPPGIHLLLAHPSDETDALKTITLRWRKRVWEAKLFADPEVIASVKAAGITLSTWREIGRRYRERCGASKR